MNPSHATGRMVRFLLPAAVVIEVVHDVLMLTHAVMTGDRALIPGAVVRILLIGGLGGLAILRGSRWARRLFAGFQFATAGVLLLGAFFTIPAGELDFDPGLILLSFGYFMLGAFAIAGGVAEPPKPAPDAGEARTIRS